MAETTSTSSSGNKLRVAMIGAGGIAGTHMHHYAAFDDVEIVGISDVNEAALAQKAEQFNIAETFTDYKDMLAKLSPDAVSICTPNFLHCQNTVDALNAGAHVMVEKPMAMSSEEAQKMVDTAKQTGKKLVIGFQYRFDPRVTFLRGPIIGGEFGDMLYTRVQAMRRRGIPNWGVFGRKDLQGGGPMINIGVHMMECAHFTMGAPKPVAAVGKTWTYLGDKEDAATKMTVPMPNWDWKTYTVEDLAVGQIRFENGAVMTIESSFAAHIPENQFTFQVMGQQGGGTFDPPVIFKDEHGHMVDKKPGYLPDTSFGSNFQRKMRNFVDHVLHGTETMAPGEHGLMVQKMLEGIYKSAEAGKEINID